MGGMVMRRFLLADPSRARRASCFMDTSRGPAARLDTELVVRRRSEVVRTGGHGGAASSCPTSSTCSVRTRTNGCSPSGPASREYAEHKWRALSPVMWTTLMHEIVTQPDQLAELRGARACRRS